MTCICGTSESNHDRNSITQGEYVLLRKFFKILKLPKIFILRIMRENKSTKKKNDTSIKFNRYLSLLDYADDHLDTNYELIAINHLSGDKDIEGHYTTDVLCSDGKQWIRFNEEEKFIIDYDRDIKNNEDLETHCNMLIYHQLYQNEINEPKKITKETTDEETFTDSYLSCCFERFYEIDDGKPRTRSKTNKKPTIISQMINMKVNLTLKDGGILNFAIDDQKVKKKRFHFLMFIFMMKKMIQYTLNF